MAERPDNETKRQRAAYEARNAARLPRPKRGARLTNEARCCFPMVCGLRRYMRVYALSMVVQARSRVSTISADGATSNTPSTRAKRSISAHSNV